MAAKTKRQSQKQSLLQTTFEPRQRTNGTMGQWKKKTKKIGRVHMNRANKKVIKGIELN
jgi:hypothetical protein